MIPIDFDTTLEEQRKLFREQERKFSRQKKLYLLIFIGSYLLVYLAGASTSFLFQLFEHYTLR